MSGAKKITLNEFNGTDWKGFMQKTKGTYSAKKTDSGRTCCLVQLRTVFEIVSLQLLVVDEGAVLAR